ncbi:MAG: nuclease family protein [Planctomycetaceae bacterium]|nr:nuclease family protein [Planctomycetaceae bacterium]
MNLNDLLQAEQLDPETTLVLRHVPRERELRKVLPWLAAEKPAVFNAYQQTQNPKVEKQMLKAKHVVSFVGYGAGKALFVGLYEMRGAKTVTLVELRKLAAQQQLVKYGVNLDGPRTEQLLFDLELTQHFSKWKGKLVVRWPAPEISWARWAVKNQIEVEAINEESVLDANMPEWRDLLVTWDELHVMPKKWKAKLEEWRGIYFILDKHTGKGYVGAAYGKENILGRWTGYMNTGHGNNKRLLTCEPSNLRFSILERVSPDMEAKEIINLETSWKDRLHTREHGLNGN